MPARLDEFRPDVCAKSRSRLTQISQPRGRISQRASASFRRPESFSILSGFISSKSWDGALNYRSTVPMSLGTRAWGEKDSNNYV